MSSPRHDALTCFFFWVDHFVTGCGIFHYGLLLETRVRSGHICVTNPFGDHGPGGRAVTRFMFRAGICDWLACPQPLITTMTLGRRGRFRDKIILDWV
jgi:hypothetical protein